MNPHGCCCDGPGCDIATARKIYLVLAAFLGSAVLVLSAIHELI